MEKADVEDAEVREKVFVAYGMLLKIHVNPLVPNIDKQQSIIQVFGYLYCLPFM